MLTIQEFKSAVSEEIRLTRHLATKLDAAQGDWRPSPAQRTTNELLEYLALCGIGTARAVTSNDWSVIAPLREGLTGLDLAGFDAAMAGQERELHELFDGLTEEQLASQRAKLPWGTESSLGEALYGTTLRFLIAYRMQLFLYAKQSGATELSTHDAWLGMDKPAETPA